MNNKKIAGALRELAYALSVSDLTNLARVDALRKIADELDPPPKPRFEVGQWVYVNVFGKDEHLLIKSIRKEDDHYQLVRVSDNFDDDWWIHSSNLTLVPARDVVLDFGTFKGTVRNTPAAPYLLWVQWGTGLDDCNRLWSNSLKPEMRSVVKALLARQEEEK